MVPALRRLLAAGARPLWVLAPALLMGVAQPAGAQAVVQALPNPASGELSDALRRLSANPQALSALIDAGRASLRLNDMDAAAGFFSRAQAVAPGDGRVLAGLAQVTLARQDGVGALQLFDRAAASGEPLDAVSAQRGLAYDLVGMNTRAQELYGAALASQTLDRAAHTETLRRLALSYAIAGDRDASEATLLPLLQAQDLAAYRTRAFALAIAGQADEAVSIADTILPPQIAQRLGPFLRNMARLTRAQQAAAANFGTFPHPEAIGRDDPGVAAFAAGEPAPRLAQGGADARLIPGGAPLGPALAAQLSASNAPPPAAVELPPIAQEVVQALPTPSAPPPPVAEQPAALVQAVPQSPPPADASPAPALAAAAAPPAAGLAPPAPSPAQAQPQLPPQTAPQAPQRVDLALAFAEFELPPEQQPRGPASPDAVDISRITPAREAPRPPPPAPEVRLPVNPSRHWVQVATGQDVANFRYDWMRIARVSEELLAGQQPYYAPWGAANRLITGPFASEQLAQTLVSKLAARSVASFVFTSTSGERVIPLP